MKVLVTGGAGYLGKYVLSELEAQGIDYITLGRSPATHSLPHLVVDLLNSDTYTDWIHQQAPTHLIHLAWYTEHGKYWESDLNHEWVIATKRLVDTFCDSGGRHALVTGTCAEYDWRYGYCVEDLTPINPSSLYGRSKDLARRACHQRCTESNVKLSWARIFYPYGYGEPSSRLIPSLFSFFEGGAPPFGVNSLAYRDLVHVSDAARALVMCSQKETDGVINIATGQPISLLALVDMIARIYGRDPSPIKALSAPRADEPELLVASSSRLRAIGWVPLVDMNFGLTHYFSRDAE